MRERVDFCGERGDVEGGDWRGHYCAKDRTRERDWELKIGDESIGCCNGDDV